MASYPSPLDAVVRQGAGLLNIDAATNATTRVTPGKLPLGETEGAPVTRRILIQNKGSVGLTYDSGHKGAFSTDPTGSPLYLPQGGTVTFAPTSLYVQAGGTGNVDVTVTAPDGLPDRDLFGGYILLTPREGGGVVRVPYMGFKGDYQSIVAFNSPGSTHGNPVLRPSRTWGPNDPVTINLANDTTTDDLAWLWIHLDHPVRRLRFELFEADRGRAWGRIADLPYLARNHGRGWYWTLSWDGSTASGDVPSGTYVIRVTIQKALGDDDNPAHFETWTSPPITVSRWPSPDCRVWRAMGDDLGGGIGQGHALACCRLLSPGVRWRAGPPDGIPQGPFR